MLRKTMLALATSMTLGAAALTPNTASAAWGGWGHGGWGGWHGGWYHGPIVRVYGPGPVYGGCMRWVHTPYGARWVNVCY